MITDDNKLISYLDNKVIINDNNQPSQILSTRGGTSESDIRGNL